MPNSMRARLHDEIARVDHRAEPERRVPWLRFSWPRLIIGAAAAALVIGAPLVWWRTREQPGGETLRLATNQPAVARETSRLEVQSLPTVAADSAGVVAESNTETKSLDLARASPENSSALRKFADVAIAPAAPSLTRERKNEPTNLRQQFSQKLARQAFRGNEKAKLAVNILSTFQIEQDGAQIRVVDADGSTYTGRIEPISKEKLMDDRTASKTGHDAGPASNEFYFRAAGYSGSLKKPLVFEGNYIAMQSSPQQALLAPGAQSQEPLPARIVGTARITGEPPVAVDAISIAAKH